MAKYNNKVIINTSTIIDLTEDTITADKMIKGYTAHSKAGEPITGTIEDNGAISGTIDSPTASVTIPEGYTKGGTVTLDSSASNIIPGNIVKGTTILGVSGTAVGEITISYTDNSAGGQTATITGG